MALRRVPRLLPGAILLGLAAATVSAIEEASGVNSTLDEGFGAQRQGFALMRAGFESSSDAAVNAPASMNDVDDLTFSTGHAERFGTADFDCASLLIPVHANGTLGFGLARYAVGGIEIRPEGIVQPTDPELFTSADWMVSAAFARRIGKLDFGAVLHVLYRKLDQDGYGLRADAMAQYTFANQMRVGTFLRGLAPSLSTWESGYSEYEPSDLLVFMAGRWSLPYFYGNLQAGWESPPLLQLGGKSATDATGRRAILHTDEMLMASNLGAEFLFDFGLALRAGTEGMDPHALQSGIRVGAGYSWRGIVGVDYAFSTHPQLSQSHRISLRLTPSFPRFEGRHFRPGSNIRHRGKYPMEPENHSTVPTAHDKTSEEEVPTTPRKDAGEVLEED